MTTLAECNPTSRPFKPFKAESGSPYTLITERMDYIPTDISLEIFKLRAGVIVQIGIFEIRPTTQAQILPAYDETDATTNEWSNVAIASGAFEFWKRPDEDIYSDMDGDPKFISLLFRKC
jgi:hypothetical protein